MATNSVNTDWNSVLSTAQAGLTSTQTQIKNLEAQAVPLRKQMNDAKEAYDAQSRFYKEALEKYRPNPVLSEILPLQEAYQKDPTNAAKKAAWEKAKAKFDAQVAKQDQETSGFPGIIQGLYNAYSRAQERYNAVWKQLPPLYEKEAQYKQQVSQAQSSLGTQAKGTTPATTSTVSATTVPASSKPGNASIATTTTTTTTIQSSNKSSETVTKTTTVKTGSDPATPTANTKTTTTTVKSAKTTTDPSKTPSVADTLIAAADKPITINAEPLVINEIDINTGKASGKKIVVPPPVTSIGGPDSANVKPETPPTAPSAPPTAVGLTSGITNAAGAATAQDQANFAAREDWRVRLSLAPGTNYLYNAQDPGILQPLKPTDGVIFPYTPSVQVNYAANYEGTSLTHTNYKIYQYQNSSVDQVQITCEFTAQDVNEANYVLAVIHFFRTMTKMFYGQDSDPKNGTPPPLCYLYGMGGYQFDALPLAISGFSYSLPQDVDYIKTTGVSPAGTPQPSVDNGATDPGRLGGNIAPGGGPAPPNYGTTPSSAGESATWIPTKINISITCLPVMSRNQVSNYFSLKDYATGNLLLGTKRPGGGMW